MSKLGSRVDFFVKVIPIDFQREKYIPFKEKDVSIFFGSIASQKKRRHKKMYRLFT